MSPAEFQAEIDRLAKQAADRGLLVALGFLGYRKHVMGKDASGQQVADAQMAFYCGAQHLYGSIMGILEEGTEETPADLRRMELINAELMDFYKQMKERIKRKMQ